jgi:hypothetical protein
MVNKLQTCRCCLAVIESDAELYEFSSEVSIDSDTATSHQNFIKIGECFSTVTTLTVNDDEEDTSKICSQCLGDLKFCFQFQKKCLDAEKTYNGQEAHEGEKILMHNFTGSLIPLLMIFQINSLMCKTQKPSKQKNTMNRA